MRRGIGIKHATYKYVFMEQTSVDRPRLAR